MVSPAPIPSCASAPWASARRSRSGLMKTGLLAWCGQPAFSFKPASQYEGWASPTRGGRHRRGVAGSAGLGGSAGSHQSRARAVHGAVPSVVPIGWRPQMSEADGRMRAADFTQRETKRVDGDLGGEIRAPRCPSMLLQLPLIFLRLLRPLRLLRSLLGIGTNPIVRVLRPAR